MNFVAFIFTNLSVALFESVCVTRFSERLVFTSNYLGDYEE